MSVYLKPFDPSREFKALRFFRYDGRLISRHDRFDITAVEPRKARQLYETRFIGYADEQHVRQYPPRPPAPSQTQAPNDGGGAGDRQGLHLLLAGFVGAVGGVAGAIAAKKIDEGASGADDSSPNEPELAPELQGTAAQPDEAAPIDEAQVKRLSKLTLDQLRERAAGLELPEGASRRVIAEALVRAGRTENEPA